MGVVHILAINSLFLYTITYLILIQKKMFDTWILKKKKKKTTNISFDQAFLI